MRSVTALKGGLSTTNAQVAANLRQLADRVDQGEFGQVDTVVSIVESAGGYLARSTTGKPLDVARVVGLLTMAISRECKVCDT